MTCPNTNCGHVHGVDNYFTDLGLSNFNIWLMNKSLFQQISLHDKQIPIAVCSICIKDYELDVAHDRCRICLELMPDPKADQYANVHNHLDTNYAFRSICNVCANQKWNSLMRCFCGDVVHEVDTINIKPPFITTVNKDDHKLFYDHMTYMHLSEFLSPKETMYLYVDRGCTKCVTTGGLITEHGMNSVIKSIESTDIFHLHLNSSNVLFVDYQNNPSISVTTVETFYIQPDTNTVAPAIVGHLVKKNPGYCARITKESNLF